MDRNNPNTVFGMICIPALFLLTHLESTIDPVPPKLNPEERAEVNRLKQSIDLTKDKANQNTLKTYL